MKVNGESEFLYSFYQVESSCVKRIYPFIDFVSFKVSEI